MSFHMLFLEDNLGLRSRQPTGRMAGLEKELRAEECPLLGGQDLLHVRIASETSMLRQNWVKVTDLGA